MSSSDIRAYAEAIFADLLADSVLSTTIEAHREIKRGQAVCATCGTRCRSHAPIAPTSGATSAAPSREPSPAKAPTLRSAGYAVGPERGTGGGTGVGSGSGRMDGAGNAFFDCLVCGRSVTSARYAPHLASCLGLSGSTRRGASRMAAAKARMGSERASPSPYLASENDSDADSTSGKRKKYNGMKRGASPTKMFKKKHAPHAGSAPPPSTNKPHAPSRLGRPPINKAQSASPLSPGKEKDKLSFRKREGSAASTASVASRPRSATPSVGRKTVPGQTKTAPGGQAGQKTLPGAGAGTPPVSGQVQETGDESSEADDDY